jgi:hypothetical protein
MARRSAIDVLPSEVRRWLDRALSAQGFAQYQQLEELLREKGFSVSKSSIHRYGQKLERRLAAIRASTEAAKLISEASPDEMDARSEALTSMIQTELFETLVNLQEAADDEQDPAARVKMLSSAAKNIATLTRSSVNLKRYQADAEERGRQRLIEEQRAALEAVGNQLGVTEETKALIRRELGID